MTASSPPIRVAVGIDVGGTKTAAARVGEDGSVLAIETMPTPADDVDATIATIVKAARAVITPEVGAVGIAAAGLVRWGTGELVFAPNLAWRGVSLSSYLQTELGLPTVAEGETVADLLADEAAFESYDADKSAEHSYAFVHLNQLAVEHALGGR